MAKRVVLAYSGGLDTSVAVRWMIENLGVEVICLSADVGQEGTLEGNEAKALGAGAIAYEQLDLREEFARDYLAPVIKANALYENKYPLVSALSRPLIVKHQVELARRYGADGVAHGCTGKGNDQVRFEVSAMALAPDLELVAPVRNWGFTREDSIHYAEQHQIPVRATREKLYSIDDNLWGRSSEGRTIEDLSAAPDPDVFQLVTRPEEAPDTPLDVAIEFEGGRPVALDGERLGLVALLERLTELGCAHGVGIVDHIEDRVVGLKVRDIYEVPAATIVLTAHKELEKLVCTSHQNQFKPQLDNQWAYLAYAGLWWEPLREDLDAYMESVNAQVTGSITLRLFKGNCTVVGRTSPNAVYDQELAGFSESGGLFSQQASPGFIELWTLQSRMAYQVRSRKTAS